MATVQFINGVRTIIGDLPVAKSELFTQGTNLNEFFIGEPTGFILVDPPAIPPGNWGVAGGNDTFVASGGEDTIDGGDRIQRGGSQRDCVDYSNWGSAIAANLSLKIEFDQPYVDPFGVQVALIGLVWKGSGFDYFVSDNGENTLLGRPEASSIECIKGTRFNDTIEGSAKANELYGNAGNDLIKGLAGNDTLAGGDGNDTLDGGVGADSIKGDAGNDSILGGDGNDTIDGGADNDTIRGGNGADSILGGDGNDTVLGDAGNDKILGGAGNDSLDGGANDDQIVGGLGNDTILGGAGNDTLTGDLGNDSIDGGEGNDLLIEATFKLAGANVVDGGNDTMFGGLGNDTMAAGVGDDDMQGGDGADVMYGEEGADAMCGNAGNDLMYGDRDFQVPTDIPDGNDTMSGGTGNDTMYGELDNDDMYGGAGNDSIDGGVGNDNLFGGTGNDTIITGAGADYVNAGAGADSIVAGNDNAFDYFYFGCNSFEPGVRDILCELERCDPSDGIFNVSRDFNGVVSPGCTYDVVDVSGIAVAVGLAWKVACVSKDDCLDVGDIDCAPRGSSAPLYYGNMIANQVEPDLCCLFDALVVRTDPKTGQAFTPDFYPFGVMFLDNFVDADGDGRHDDSILSVYAPANPARPIPFQFGPAYQIAFIDAAQVHWLNPADCDNPFLLVA